jgi:hypothetical protein
VKRWLLNALLCALVSCTRPRSAPSSDAAAPPEAGPAAAAVREPDPIGAARREFEPLPSAYASGTHKLYSRGDFLPLDDPRAMSEGDFLGRARALFDVALDELVLRHRATGFVVTIYAMQSGPSYGGGPRYEGDLPDAAAAFASAFADAKAREARIAADPILAAGRPVDWSKIDLKTLPPGELLSLRQKEKDWQRHFYDVSAPPGCDKVVARLDQLLSSVPPADWEAIRYYSEAPSVYRVGASHGVAFQDELPFGPALEKLLADSESAKGSIVDTAAGVGGSHERVVEYWLAHGKKIESPAGSLPRVREAWFRWVESLRDEPREYRKLVLERAREAIAPLGLDRVRAEAALRRAAG